MMESSAAIRAAVENYCVAIGRDPLLVQGAGGNVSWKDGETLWIKASGTWLARAKEQDIFVPVDLTSLRDAIAGGDFAATPTVLGVSMLRPSIETVLHALMPQPVVVHLHAVEILAHLVRENYLADVQLRLGNSVTWTSVPYKKPGVELATAVSRAVCERASAPNVLFLKNHGVVVGGNNVAEVSATLKILSDAFRTTPIEYGENSMPAIDIGAGYIPVPDLDLHCLATAPALLARLNSQWALYPDHVVFLGETAKIYPDVKALQNFLRNREIFPELIFLKGVGVFVQPSFSVAKQMQLRCYYEVLVRQSRDQVVDALLPREIADLLNWDAEQYRIGLSK